MTAGGNMRDSSTWQVVTRILSVVSSALVTITTAMIIWILSTMWTIQTEVQRVDSRVSVIEANRFTAGDGVDLLKQFNAAIMDINVRLSEIPHIKEKLDEISRQLVP